MPEKNHWEQHASRWALVTSPLKPDFQDVETFESIIKWKYDNVLLLGVTPELQNISENLCALDNNPEMIEKLSRSQLNAKLCDWREVSEDHLSQLPLSYVIGDGSLNVVSYHSDWHLILPRLQNLLRQGGTFAARYFVAPDVRETLDQVLQSAYAGEIPNFSAFKWRFAMALPVTKTTPDVAVVDIHAAFEKMVPDRLKLSKLAGWPIEAIDVIDNYKGSAAVYCFPTLGQVQQRLGEYFDVGAVHYGTYYLADRCPIVCAVNTKSVG